MDVRSLTIGLVPIGHGMRRLFSLAPGLHFCVSRRALTPTALGDMGRSSLHHVDLRIVVQDCTDP